MLDLKYLFKNINLTESNDHVLEGSPYLLNGYSYKFLIIPKCLYWRFGIRLSKTQDIKFVFSGNRHLRENENDFRDIHISVGDKIGKVWTNPNKFHIAQYNFPRNYIKDHLLSYESGYKPLSLVEFRVKFDDRSNLLNVGYSGDGIKTWNAYIPLEGFSFFQIFAWADGIEFELNCSIQISSNNKLENEDLKLTPFKVGKLTFRLGDMFDPYMRKKGNLILLPASSNGTATNSVLKRASELGIPSPSSNLPGNIHLYKPNNSNNILKVGYAYSVNDQTSDLNIIKKLAETIYSTLHAILKEDNQVIKVNLPLLGTGAGAVPPIEVAIIFDEILNKSFEQIEYFISIPNENTYKIIKQRMLGKYFPMEDEKFQKPKPILNIENDLMTTIDHTAFHLNEFGKIVLLSLNSIKNRDIEFINQFDQLENLTLVDCEIDDLSSIENLVNLHSIFLISTPVSKFDFLKRLKKLTTLQISKSSIIEISFLSNLINLHSLDLSENQISSLLPLEDLKDLKFLNLNDNLIENIDPISLLISLEKLLISNNLINRIESIVNLPKLLFLDLSSNKILDISCILSLNQLQYLKADNNPYLESKELILIEEENHLIPIKSLLIRQAESNTQELILPVKILLLGNHASGKSSVLHYLLNNSLKKNNKSTHLIKIEGYPKKFKQIPQAIFFDFGGQDYYHGVYRAFLTAGAIYLILWNKENNKNQKRTDSNGVLTQDFTINYWLCQKNYYEMEKQSGEIDPVILIQTHSETDKRERISNLNEVQEIYNEFYVSLAANSIPPFTGFQKVNETALQYLKATIQELINNKCQKSHEPKWYIDFINFIIREIPLNDHNCKSLKNDILPMYNRLGPDKENYLKNDLDQLHKKGIILYYNESGLNDAVWLNPGKLVNYIHSAILTKNKNSKFKGRIPIQKFDGVSIQIIMLLQLQKVIFKHDFGDNGNAEYIVPNFLPLSEEDKDYDLNTFGVSTPTFILKFNNFLPFGLINQIICHFGDLPEKKKFWRDRILFTFNNTKILILLDFQNLEIKVSCSFSISHSENDISDVKSYLFYSIMAIYWDFKEILSFDIFLPYFKSGLKIDEISKDSANYKYYQNCKGLYENHFYRPNDLYISIDDINYISYIDLCSMDSAVMINSKQINSNRELENFSKVIPIYPFQPFTKRPLKRAKKVAISYSTKDLNLVNKFRDYLVYLHDEDLIEHPFQCTQLIAGEEWDDEIQRKFNEADIIFFMVSENLMANKYVKDIEIKNAIERRFKDKSFKIIPIILVHCQWKRNGKYNLGNYTSLPFKAQPVTAFLDQHEAWFCAIELIKIMIERDVNPTNEEVILSNEVKRIQEDYFTKR